MTSSIDRLAARLKRLERIQRDQSTTPQLAYSAIEDGAIEDYEGDELKMVIGRQFDGAHIAMPVTGPTPPTPAPVVVAPIIGGLRVSMRDPLFEDPSVVIPTDFSRWEIHVSTVSGFTPDLSSTLYATIESPRGGEVGIALPATEHFVRVVCRSASGKGSIPSIETAATPRLVLQDDLDPSINLGGGGTDGDAPADAPTPDALIGIEQIYVSWPRVANADPVEYEVAASATTGFDPATNIVGVSSGTMVIVSHLPGEVPVPTGAPTYVRVRAVDADGPGPWSVEVAASARAGVDQADLAASEQAAQQAAADAQAAQTAASDAAAAAAAAQAEADLAQQAADAAAADSSTSAADAAAAASAAQMAQTNATNAANAAAASEAAATAAEQAAADAAADAEMAAESANGTSRVWYTDTTPVTTGRVNKHDDTWFQIDTNGDVIAIYRWDSAANAGAGAWVEKPLTHETIASIDAGKITVGEMDASRLVAGTVSTRELGAAVVTTTNLAADAVTAEKIAARAVTAESLEADILLSSTIRTGLTGERRVVIEAPTAEKPGGIRLVGADDRSIVNLPLDGGAAEFNGSINATDGATIDGGLELRGANNAFATGSSVQLDTGIGPSATPPGVSVGFDTGAFGGPSVGYLKGNVKGYDTFYGSAVMASDEGNTADQGWLYHVPKSGSPASSIDQYEWASAMRFDLKPLHIRPLGGVVMDNSAGDGRTVYVLGQYSYNHPTTSLRGDWYTFHLTLNANGTITVLGQVFLASDTFLDNKPIIIPSASASDDYVIAHWPSGADYVNAKGYTQSSSTRNQVWTKSTAQGLSSYVGTGTNRDLVGGFYGSTDVNGSTLFLAFRDRGVFFNSPSTTFNVIPDHTFMTDGLVDALSARTGQNMTPTFERFESVRGFDLFGGAAVTKYTSITWVNSASSTWWAAFSWAYHDGSSYTAETYISAMRQFTMTKRATVTVSTPSFPEGVNAFRVYMHFDNTMPAGSEMMRSAPDPTPGTTAKKYTPLTTEQAAALFAGPSPYVGISGFPAQDPAAILSQAEDVNGPLVQLHGNGSWRLAGLSGDYLGNVYGAVPVGTMTLYPDATPPNGWLRCNGAQFDGNTYPALAALLSNKFGAVSGSLYRLPNRNDTPEDVPLTSSGVLLSTQSGWTIQAAEAERVGTMVHVYLNINRSGATLSYASFDHANQHICTLGSGWRPRREVYTSVGNGIRSVMIRTDGTVHFTAGIKDTSPAESEIGTGRNWQVGVSYIADDPTSGPKMYWIIKAA